MTTDYHVVIFLWYKCDTDKTIIIGNLIVTLLLDSYSFSS